MSDGAPFQQKLTANPDALELIPEQLIHTFQVVPLEIVDGGPRQGRFLRVATVNPNDLDLENRLSFRVGLPVELVGAEQTQIETALVKPGLSPNDTLESVLSSFSPVDLERFQRANVSAAPSQVANEAPVVRLVDTILFGALSRRATDVHLEPRPQGLWVRYRIDGVLHDEAVIPPLLCAPLLSRLKILAKLDIAEQRLPQDGSFIFQYGGRAVDIRIATAPTLHGETCVLRLLNRETELHQLTELGMDGVTLDRYRRSLHSPHGIVLVTGPTGAGKTTTLYASLNELRTTERKIITVEDPVERHIDGITQIPVHPKIGFGFPEALRHLLRHDPEVIMVGEIRDLETATIALHAAQTGHLVLATLHTNDAPTGILRLIDMGVEPYRVAGAVRAVLAQRLLRVPCKLCTESNVDGNAPYDPTLTTGMCTSCAGTGYSGRTGIFEVMLMTPMLEQTVLDGSLGATELRNLAIADGFRSMWEDGREKVVSGKAAELDLTAIWGAN